VVGEILEQTVVANSVHLDRKAGGPLQIRLGAGDGGGQEEIVSSQLSVAKVLANLEAQMALHKEREAFHAEQEVFHRGQRPPGRRPQHRKNTDGQG
jgi:hypothetical protein